MLEQIAYQIPRREQRQTVYHVGDLEGLSSTALYTPKPGDDMGGLPMFGSGNMGLDFTTGRSLKPIGNVSEFKPASNFGLGPGIAKESEGFLERYRAGEHEDFGKDHLNLEYINPITKKPLINLHIDMKEE
jgi:hypothetical protein